VVKFQGRGEADFDRRPWVLHVYDHGFVRMHVGEFVCPIAVSCRERKLPVFALRVPSVYPRYKQAQPWMTLIDRSEKQILNREKNETRKWSFLRSCFPY